MSTAVTPRIGARVLLDARDHVLLIHACDPHDRHYHRWEVPGGDLEQGEQPEDAAVREVAEEIGLIIPSLGQKLWIRESRLHYKGRDHHRQDHVLLRRIIDAVPKVALKPTENEKAGLIERRWWSAAELRRRIDKLIPAQLPSLLDKFLAGTLDVTPLSLLD
ncbi:NUDIX domain-containing protein [Lentzea sp. DG1S-22]|uniref:NUDIX domain-containing protein n=1 Tax=Lentzea sp. DG1S-22 TaxID=3108822 RepID=UPI002E775944|nr:NUDIX domain-containing protein [Lentzea sp. DG1S-22]WVH82106.1 NUDIX domain-containing protein [Lentzea sp. DG1S-22]